LKDRCIDKPSNDELADAVGVNDKTKAGWFYKGKRPSEENLQALAKVLAEKMHGTDEHELLAEMKRHYALAGLCEKLESRIGRDKIIELVGSLYHQANQIQSFFEIETKPVEENYPSSLLHFTLGAGRSFNALWLKHLWKVEKDNEWKRDIVCVERDWVSRLFQVNLRFSDEGVLERRPGTSYLYINPYDKPPDGGYYGALLHRDDDGISAVFDYVSAKFIDNKIDGEMKIWGGTGPEAYDWDEKTERQFRAAIASKPASARVHLDLGVFLGLNCCLPTQLEEGYQECIKAINLQPKWELTWVETANILLHAGDSERALKILQDATNNIKRPSYRLIYTIAFARMMNRDFAGALEMFIKAIHMKPDFAPAFENAAFCAFRQGETLDGRRYAKIARRLGISTTYELYDVGKTKQKQSSSHFEIFCETIHCKEKNCKGRTEVEEIRERLRQGKP
jgi:tetratricopeptide (TPR) repeat protein